MWVHTVSGVVLLWNDVLSEGIRLAWIRLVIVVYKPDDALTREQALVAIAKTTPQGCNFLQSLSENFSCNTCDSACNWSRACWK